jgi:UDP-N-acetylglucosamine 1-carboxyvinyltransferase
MGPMNSLSSMDAGTAFDALTDHAPRSATPASIDWHRARPDSFVVRSSGPLHGTVRAGGAKNSVLKLMAATLLAEGTHVLTNVPDILDVEIMSDMLRALGASVAREPGGRLLIDSPPPDALVPEAPYELVDRMRASIVVLGPLLTRCGYARVSMPGGDDFGDRPIDFHLGGLASMGARFETVHGNIEGTVAHDAPGSRLVGTQVVLEYPSHTATDNILMAAVLAKGTTVIENAAREPEVCDLAAYLVSMGAKIRGAGTSHVEIDGVDELCPASHAVVPDRVVAATYLAAAGLCGGEVVVEDARIDHMTMLVRKLGAMGVRVEQRSTGVAAMSDGRLRSVDVATLPYPGVATDYKPLLVAMLTVADGVAIVTENLFAGRFRYIDELRRMGADVRTEGHHAVVRGVLRLSGAPVRATDIRAGAALVLAGLVAEGETVVANAAHVDRGYEDLAGDLMALGAQVERR